MTRHLTRADLDSLGPARTLDLLATRKAVVWGSLSRPHPIGITGESGVTAHFDLKQSVAPPIAPPPAPTPDLDLRGEVCPFTFVRTKLRLEEMNPGERLRVIVDHEPASRNIPRSAKEWGQTILHVGPLGAGVWQILIERKA